jgi:hypothetical protein
MPTVGAQMKRMTMIAVALAAMALGGGAEVLARADVHAKVTIKVNRTVGKDTIKGRVAAKDRACERGRKVRLVVRKPNRTKRRVGAPKANRKGKWKFTPPPNKDSGGYSGERTRYADPGDYVAKVREVNAGGVTCAAAKSSPVHIG